MTFVKTIKGLIELLFRMLHLIMAFLRFIIVTPFSFLIPKDNHLITLVGIYKGDFIGNIKYLFLYLHERREPNIKYCFLTGKREIYTELRKYGLPVIYFPSFKGIMTLLRTKIVIVDSFHWVKKCKYLLLFNCVKIQLWHGVGFKKIEMDLYSKKRKNLLRQAIYTLTGRFPKYDLLTSTSEFYSKNVFQTAFEPKRIIETGYPRNDIFFRKTNELDWIQSDQQSFQQIKELRKQGYKAILYVPTLRDGDSSDAIIDGALKIDSLVEFAQKHKLVFVFKFHPSPKYRYRLDGIKNIIVYDNSKDIYPVMPFIDLLITDYSSIYMDFLLLDKPVLFFPYDYQDYIQKDREIQFDYNWLTPGPKCFTQEELQNLIKQFVVDSQDQYQKQRKEVKNLAFQYHDGKASERIWAFIHSNYL